MNIIQIHRVSLFQNKFKYRVVADFSECITIAYSNNKLREIRNEYVSKIDAFVCNTHNIHKGAKRVQPNGNGVEFITNNLEFAKEYGEFCNGIGAKCRIEECLTTLESGVVYKKNCPHEYRVYMKKGKLWTDETRREFLTFIQGEGTRVSMNRALDNFAYGHIGCNLTNKSYLSMYLDVKDQPVLTQLMLTYDDYINNVVPIKQPPA